jgi:hypothetical protein
MVFIFFLLFSCNGFFSDKNVVDTTSSSLFLISRLLHLRHLQITGLHPRDIDLLDPLKSLQSLSCQTDCANFLDFASNRKIVQQLSVLRVSYGTDDADQFYTWDDVQERHEFVGDVFSDDSCSIAPTDKAARLPNMRRLCLDLAYPFENGPPSSWATSMCPNLVDLKVRRYSAFGGKDVYFRFDQ